MPDPPTSPTPSPSQAGARARDRTSSRTARSGHPRRDAARIWIACLVHSTTRTRMRSMAPSISPTLHHLLALLRVEHGKLVVRTRSDAVDALGNASVRAAGSPRATASDIVAHIERRAQHPLRNRSSHEPAPITRFIPCLPLENRLHEGSLSAHSRHCFSIHCLPDPFLAPTAACTQPCVRRLPPERFLLSRHVLLVIAVEEHYQRIALEREIWSLCIEKQRSCEIPAPSPRTRAARLPARAASPVESCRVWTETHVAPVSSVHGAGCKRRARRRQLPTIFC